MVGMEWSEYMHIYSEQRQTFYNLILFQTNAFFHPRTTNYPDNLVSQFLDMWTVILVLTFMVEVDETWFLIGMGDVG